jgi:hypothetical protein
LEIELESPGIYSKIQSHAKALGEALKPALDEAFKPGLPALIPQCGSRMK